MRGPIVLAVLATIGFGSAACRGETWAERLGYPAGKKVIILHAHGMGVCYEANSAAATLLEQGLTFSSSASPPCPWFIDFAQWSHRRGDLDVGIEITVNSEEASYRWQPVESDDQVASLVDVDGFLWSKPMQTMVSGRADEVEIEMRAQIERGLKQGVQPTHLTSHMGTLFTRLDLIEVYLRVSREYWIPAVLVELTPESIERFQKMGLPLEPEMVDLIQNYPLPKLDDLQFTSTADSYEQLRASFLELLANLKPGLTQVALRPAASSPALPRITADCQARVWDFQLLQDPEVREALAGEEVVLTTWREVMRRYEGVADLTLEEPTEPPLATDP